MTAEPLPTWLDLCRAQGEVLARRQALALGMSEDAWQWAHEQRRMRRLLPGVSLGHAGEPSLGQRAWAAVLHCGDGAALTGDLALVLLGMRLDAPGAIDVAVPDSRVVRPGAALALEPPGAGGRPPREGPGRAGPPGADATDRAAADRPAARRRLRPERSGSRVAGRRSRTATAHDALARARGALAHAAPEAARPRPGGARRRRARRARRERARLPAPAAPPRAALPDRLQRPVRRGRTRYLDAWWERQRVAVEIDGRHHVEVGQWDDDVLRANDVVVAERHDRALLLRYTCGNLRHDEPQVASQLAAVLG